MFYSRGDGSTGSAVPKKSAESASRSGTALSTRPVLLNARGTQTRDPVRLERSLPGKKLLLRKLIAPQNLFHCDRAAAHSSHYRRFAAGNPPRRIKGWQIVHLGCSQRGLLDDAIQRVLQDLGRVQ